MPITMFEAGHNPWQQKDQAMPLQDLINGYANGMAGCWIDPEGNERFKAKAKATGGYSQFGDAATAAGFADNFAGQLVLPFIWHIELFPGCYPGSAQERGDCVSHSGRSGGFGTVCGDIVGGLPDEETGLVEGVPEISEAARKDMVLAAEWQWWCRRSGGDGWYLSACAETMIEDGVMLRQNYPDLGFDLTNYSYSNTAKYARSGPPDKALVVGRTHKIATAADANSFEELRDAFGNGHGIGSDGGEGWSSTRDENGFSKRSGSWSHSFPQIGVDDRDVIKAKYGQPLVLCMNNWAAWNGGGRDIYQSAALVPPEKKGLWISLGLVNPVTGNIMIPPGAWWAKWSDMKNRDFKVFGGARGWAKKTMPTLGAGGII